jgi:hypothetical protein
MTHQMPEGLDISNCIGEQQALRAFRRGDVLWSFVSRPAVQIGLGGEPGGATSLSLQQAPLSSSSSSSSTFLTASSTASALKGILPDLAAVRPEAALVGVMVPLSEDFPSNALSQQARDTANQVFRSLGYFTSLEFYSGVARTESLVEWWRLVNRPAPGGAGITSLVRLSETYIKACKRSAGELFSADPSTVYTTLPGETPRASGHEHEGLDSGKRFLSALQLPTVSAYGKVLARFISWLNHRAVLEGQQLPFPAGTQADRLADGDADALATAAARLFSLIRAVEWEGKGTGLGVFSHYLFCCALVLARGNCRDNDNVQVSQLTLCSARAWADQAKALLWVLKGTVILSRRGAVTARDLSSALPFFKSKSVDMIIHVLAASKRVEKQQGGRDDVVLDPLHSMRIGAPSVRVILETGIFHVQWDTLRYGAARGQLHVVTELTRALEIIGLPAETRRVIADPLGDGGRVTFRPGALGGLSHISHIMHKGIDLGDVIHAHAQAFMAEKDHLARKRVKEILTSLQGLLFWLLPVACGACMRTSDTRALKVGIRAPRVDHAEDILFAYSDLDIRVHSLCNKTEWMGVPGLILNSLSYLVGVWLAVFILLKDVIGEEMPPFTKDGLVWFKGFSREKSNQPYEAFANTSRRLIGQNLTIGEFRQVTSRLCHAAEDDFEKIVDGVLNAGAVSIRDPAPAAKKSKVHRETIASIICQSSGECVCGCV